MDAHDLARWTRFAAKGGIGKCTAVVDCIAQEMGEDLMFLKDDEITVLMQLPEPGIYLGHCEGVVGRFSGKDVCFHGKLKKPVMAKRGSVGASGSDSRMSISLLEGHTSRTEHSGESSRRPSESPSDSRPASRAKRSPSPPHPKSHAPMHSYSTSYSRFSEDQSPGISRSTTVVGTPSRTATLKESRPSSIKSGHAKPPQMVTSISGASIYSVGSASVYSEASTATSAYSAADDASRRTRSRNGSLSSIDSGETEKEVPGEMEYGNIGQANSVLMSDVMGTATPSVSNMALPASASASSSLSASTSASSTSFASTSTANDSFGSVGSISDLETKQFDMTKFGVRTETQAGFVLVPPPLGIGDNKNGLSSPTVAPLRLTKSPRLAPSPGLPPSSPLPVPPAMSGENPRSTSVSPALPSPLSPGFRGSRPPSAAPRGVPGSLSPGLPGSLMPGPRSPGLPGSLSPGFRSPAFPNSLSQYTFPGLPSSGSSSPNPSTPSPSLTNPYANRNYVSSTTVSRTPPSSSYGLGQVSTAPLSPPPSSPLPPLPSTPASASLPSSVTPLPTPGTPPAMGSAASAAASGRTSPLAALPSSLPSPTMEKRAGRRDGHDKVGSGTWDEEGGNTTRLSTLDAFRRQDEDEDSGEDECHLEDEEERPLRLSERKDEANESGDDDEIEKEEDAHSDGAMEIGLSLMGALGGDDDDEDYEPPPEKKSRGGDDNESVKSNAGKGHNGNASAENGSTSAMPWTRYTPSSPISPQSSNGRPRSGEEEDRHGDEDEDDGAYWDHIYDDYRYSRYSLASKRFSAASKLSGISKASSRARANAPPVPVPPDRPSVDASRPSITSDGANGYPRPSFESVSSGSMSASMPFTRPSLTRSGSDESTHEISLTAQFPAVPVYVPVRTESRLRVVHDGYTQGGDDHGEREQRVTLGSTEDDDSVEVGLNIEVIEAAEDDDDGHGQEVMVGRPFTSPNTNAGLSPLLHTTFGSPHSSRFTDVEEGSDLDHGRRYSNKSGKSAISSSVEGPPKSPIDGGGMASALRAKMDVERAPSSGTGPSLAVPTSGPDVSPSEGSGVRAIVVDDEEGHVTGINTITADDPILATEATPLLPAQTPNVTQTTVATDPVRRTPPAADRVVADDGEKSSFLRPRPPQTSPSPHPFARTSMFLPHPNAPKTVPQSSQGPMYGRSVPQAYTCPVNPNTGSGNATLTATATASQLATPPGTTFYSIHILHQLRTAHQHHQHQQPQGLARRPPLTVFARCQSDLNTSMGPVPILFSLDPFPVGLPMPGPLAGAGVGPRPMGRGTQVGNMMPTRAATVSAPVRRGGGEGAIVNMNVKVKVPTNEGAVGAGVGDASALRLPKRSATAVGSVSGLQGVGVGAESLSPSLPIPREGFVPRVGAARPRSRSFSSFGAHGPAALPQARSREEPAMKTQDGVPSRNATLPPSLMARHPPSPLVLQSSNKDGGLASPVVQSPAQFKIPPSPFSLHEPNGSLASPIVSSPDRDTTASSDPRSVGSPPSLMPGRQRSLDTSPGSNSIERPRKSSDSGDSSSLASPPPIPEAVIPQTARSSPLTQELSLRTKLSLPALRMKANIRSKLDDAVSVMSLAVSGENETVQVQDMDFELVKPSLPQVTTGWTSQDSTLTGRDVDAGKTEASPILGDAASMHSSAPRSPLVPTTTNAGASTESAESIDAHRQRELKWMALLPTVPPSQARKSKKVRKLLQEGLPSSVRYLVWCHLTDSKARALPGVYAKLGRRPPVPAFGEIVRDAVEGFPDQVQLHTARGPLVSLLQAYLSMVPDIQYSSGLTFIAGHLLLLAPEEDAFWIFASMMDAHLRAYFSTNTVQIEIDASLFSKALEVIDPVLTKKLYMTLSIAPASITRPWFSTLFVGSLSVDHLHRVWDIFLYDGIPYLYRVGLVLINCVRHLLLQANTEEVALAHLVHPPPACLPSPSELLVLAANVKLKDDDVRKQRVKMEQQLKRTTQARPPNGVTNVQTAAISLPKTSIS